MPKIKLRLKKPDVCPVERKVSFSKENENFTFKNSKDCFPKKILDKKSKKGKKSKVFLSKSDSDSEKQDSEVSQLSQEKPGGNTKNPRPQYQLYRWFFVLACDRCTIFQLSQLLKSFCKKFKFSVERGEEKTKENPLGFLHYSGNFSLRIKEYYPTVLNLMPYSTHLEATKDDFAADKYNEKEKTHISGPYTHKSVIGNCPIEKLRNWQQETIDIVFGKNDDRNLFWVSDFDPIKNFSVGKIGKSVFADYCEDNLDAIVFPNAKTNDLAFALPDDPNFIVFDFGRDMEKKVNLSVIEELKNGRLFSPKFESKTKRFKRGVPILVLANFFPDFKTMNRLSLDRWNIYQIKNDMLFKIEVPTYEKMYETDAQKNNPSEKLGPKFEPSPSSLKVHPIIYG